MCGIAGVLSLKGDPIPVLKSAWVNVRAIAHRGPDDHGCCSEKRQKLGFVHRRLAVIDYLKRTSPWLVKINILP